MNLKGMFMKLKPQGRDWVRRLDPENKRVFIDIGLQAGDHGKMGGAVRAATATRCGKGHFLSNNGGICQVCQRKNEMQ
jgi:hypothetical protein